MLNPRSVLALGCVHPAQPEIGLLTGPPSLEDERRIKRAKQIDRAILGNAVEGVSLQEHGKGGKKSKQLSKVGHFLPHLASKCSTRSGTRSQSPNFFEEQAHARILEGYLVRMRVLVLIEPRSEYVFHGFSLQAPAVVNEHALILGMLGNVVAQKCPAQRPGVGSRGQLDRGDLLGIARSRLWSNCLVG